MTLTAVALLRGFVGCLVLDGPLDAMVLESYAPQILCPDPSPLISPNSYALRAIETEA